MRRRLTIIATFAAIGFAINLCVITALCYTHRASAVITTPDQRQWFPPGDGLETSIGLHRSIKIKRGTVLGRWTTRVILAEHLGFRVERMTDHQLPFQNRSPELDLETSPDTAVENSFEYPRHHLTRVSVGFPFFSVKSDVIHRTSEPLTNGVPTVIFTIDRDPQVLAVSRNAFGHDSFSIPYKPVVLGLIANTAFYGWLVWFAARMFISIRTDDRKDRRSKRGLCPTCAYDLTGNLTTCPECGTRSDG